MDNPKILFDENFGRPIIKDLAKLLSWHISKPVVTHILDFFEKGVSDDQWLDEISNDHWIIITTDRAKKYGGPKLPTICKEKNLTHILISAGLHKEKQFEKVKAIICLWNNIVDLYSEPRGSRFSLRFNTAHKPILERRNIN